MKYFIFTMYYNLKGYENIIDALSFKKKSKKGLCSDYTYIK